MGSAFISVFTCYYARGVPRQRSIPTINSMHDLARYQQTNAYRAMLIDLCFVRSRECFQATAGWQGFLRSGCFKNILSQRTQLGVSLGRITLYKCSCVPKLARNVRRTSWAYLENLAGTFCQ